MYVIAINRKIFARNPNDNQILLEKTETVYACDAYWYGEVFWDTDLNDVAFFGSAESAKKWLEENYFWLHEQTKFPDYDYDMDSLCIYKFDYDCTICEYLSNFKEI